MEKKELLETVEALAKQVNDAQLDGIEVETDDFRIKLTKHHRPPHPHGHPMPPLMAQDNMYAATTMAHPTEAQETAAPSAAGTFIKSPIIGTFYAASAPGKPPFVSAGDRITKGSVVCIVESMKLMNEITSDFDGTVAEVLVSDGEAVEFDQPLFRIDS